MIEDVYDAAVAASGVEGLGEVNLDGEPVKKGNVVSALIDTISGVIQPILAVLCAAGMIKGVLSILVASDGSRRQTACTRFYMRLVTASSTSCRLSLAIPRQRSLAVVSSLA